MDKFTSVTLRVDLRAAARRPRIIRWGRSLAIQYYPHFGHGWSCLTKTVTCTFNPKVLQALSMAAVLSVCFIRESTAQVIVPPPDLLPLNQVAVPEPPNLYQYVTNKVTARKLGKAFFWDMQVGSDGLTACASCHFRAGVDNRMKNTVNPGTRAGDTTFQVVGPNGTLQMGDFPFHQRQAPGESQSDPVIRNSNDVVGSQGVRFAEFAGIIPGSAVEQTNPIPDPVFNVDGVNTRRVTGRNAPSVINAIFNFTNFWDGRAHYAFNGVNPFGPADPDAGIWFNDPQQGLVKRKVALIFGSLASLSTGPALDDVEMSAQGRTFPELARKLLSLVPLGKQLVHREDSELGALSRMVINPDGSVAAIKGLNTTYAQLIRDSFHSDLWNSDQPITLDISGGQTDEFTQMEANFSFFWGVAIQLYMATLVSDQTPFDHWLGGDASAMTDQQKEGFALFSGIGKCSLCHGGIELTNASAANSGFINNDIHFLIDLMFVADGNQVIYDTGFNNTAVTPTTDDIARGANTPFVNTLTSQPIPLSFSHLAEIQMLNLLPFQAPIMPPGVPSNMRLNKNGAFKVPSLRNVELTAPYFHNGSIMSLDDMMDFLIRGGNFPNENIADLDPDIGTGIQFMRGDDAMKQAVIAYLMSLTDPRVSAESAPFDHPELFLPNGDPEILIHIPARDSNGTPLPSQVLALNAVISPTVLTSQTVSGTVEAGLTPVVTVDTGATVGTVEVNGTDWSVLITELQEGNNVITVSVVDLGSVQTTLTEIITVVPDSTPVFTSSPGTQATVDELYIYEATATDPLGDILEYSLITAPSGMTLYPEWGLILWTPDGIQVGQHRVSLKVTDANALFSIQDFTITVSPAPDLTVPGAPATVTAVRGNAQATVSFTPPVPNGSSAITSYKVTSSPGGIIKAGSASPITVTGLKNGTSYTFTVAATNAKGTGPASLASNAVTPATAPGAPTAVTAVRGDGRATVSFTAPASNGGTPVTLYTVTSSPGGMTATNTAANPTVVTGLKNGTAYTFTVKAANAIGLGVASVASAAVTPATVPDAPKIGIATPGVLQASVAFTPPLFNGGSAITGYAVTANPGGIVKTGTASPITVTGLTYDVPYTFTVTAKNAVGTGASVGFSTATPKAAVPGAPTAVTAVRGDGRATVSFTAPASNGGTPVTLYTVTSYPGGITATNTAANPTVVNGLKNGTAYTFTVKAANAIGSSVASVASAAVTPATVPDAPKIGIATPGVLQASVAFTAPLFNGGSAITGYTVTANPGGIVKTGTASPIIVTGLTYNVPYTFSVTATNAIGTSIPSATSTATPKAAVPGAPTAVTAVRGNQQATVSFTPPASNGGTAITKYTVTSSPGGIVASSVLTPPETSITVSGLKNGTAYAFTVKATNAIGSSVASVASAAVTPATVPNAPVKPTVTAGKGQVTVSFTAPANGGSAITGYTVTPFDTQTQTVGVSKTGTASPITVTGLTYGVPYTFTVNARNAIGISDASAPSNIIAPTAVLPGAPTAVTGTRGNAQVTVSFKAPASNGGAEITSYTVTSSPGGLTASGTASPLTVAGLTNGTAYTFKVTAANVLGAGPASTASAAITPARAPDAPIIGNAVRGSGQATVYFAPPAFNGGSPITSYIVTAAPGGITASKSAGPITLLGLTPGISYTFTVKAANAMGTGDSSDPSNQVIP